MGSPVPFDDTIPDVLWLVYRSPARGGTCMVAESGPKEYMRRREYPWWLAFFRTEDEAVEYARIQNGEPRNAD